MNDIYGPFQKHVEDLTDSGEGNFQDLSANFPLAELFSSILLWAPFTMFMAFLYIIRVFGGDYGVLIPIGSALLGMVNATHSHYRASLSQYKMTRREIYFRTGIFFKRTTVVPIKRIQHIDLQSGPIDRRLNLHQVKFYTAGGGSADLKIPGLNLDVAKSLKDGVLEAIGSKNG